MMRIVLGLYFVSAECMVLVVHLVTASTCLMQLVDLRTHIKVHGADTKSKRKHLLMHINDRRSDFHNVHT